MSDTAPLSAGRRAAVLISTAVMLASLALPTAVLSWDLWVVGEIWAANSALPGSPMGGLVVGTGALFAGLAGVGLGTLALAILGVGSLVGWAGMSTLFGRDPLGFLS